MKQNENKRTRHSKKIFKNPNKNDLGARDLDIGSLVTVTVKFGTLSGGVKKLSTRTEISGYEVRQHNSSIISGILSETTKIEKSKVEVKMDVAAKIGDMIMAMGLSKSLFAAKVKKRPSVITQWLSGTHNFTLDTLVEVSEALDADVSDIFECRFCNTSKSYNPLFDFPVQWNSFGYTKIRHFSLSSMGSKELSNKSKVNNDLSISTVK